MIAPVGLVITTAVVPVMVPAPVMPPVPVAVKVTVVPLRAAPTLIGLFDPVSMSESVPPVALMELVVVMPPAAESVRLNPPSPAVDAPLPVRAMESPNDDAYRGGSNCLSRCDVGSGQVRQIYRTERAGHYNGGGTSDGAGASDATGAGSGQGYSGSTESSANIDRTIGIGVDQG